MPKNFIIYIWEDSNYASLAVSLTWIVNIITWRYRSIGSQIVFIPGTLKNFTNFAGKINVLESLFKKASGSQACKFIKKRLQHRYFPVKLAKFSRTLFLQNTSRGSFLKWETVTFCSKIFQGYLLCTTNLLQLATLTMTNYIWKCIHLPKTCFDRAFL